RRICARLRDRFVPSDSYAGDVVSKIANDRLNIHRDDRLILDDQNVGERLALDLLERFGDERIDVGGPDVDQIGCVLRRKAFERGQEQRLTGQWSDARESRMGDSLGSDGILNRFLAFLDIGGRPDRMEGLVQSKSRIDVAGKFVRFGDNRFERSPNECVAVSLAAGQCTSVAAEKRQVGGKFLAMGHIQSLSRKWAICAVFGGASELLQPWKDRQKHDFTAPQRYQSLWNK